MQTANRTDFLSENINLGILEDAVTKLVSVRKKNQFSPKLLKQEILAI